MRYFILEKESVKLCLKALSVIGPKRGSNYILKRTDTPEEFQKMLLADFKKKMNYSLYNDGYSTAGERALIKRTFISEYQKRTGKKARWSGQVHNKKLIRICRIAGAERVFSYLEYYFDKTSIGQFEEFVSFFVSSMAFIYRDKTPCVECGSIGLHSVFCVNRIQSEATEMYNETTKNDYKNVGEAYNNMLSDIRIHFTEGSWQRTIPTSS